MDHLHYLEQMAQDYPNLSCSYIRMSAWTCFSASIDGRGVPITEILEKARKDKCKIYLNGFPEQTIEVEDWATKQKIRMPQREFPCYVIYLGNIGE